MLLVSLVYLAMATYCIVWRWRSPGSLAVKLLWTLFCVLVPAGPALMLEISRPEPPTTFKSSSTRRAGSASGSFHDFSVPGIPPMPGAGLAILSSVALVSGLLASLLFFFVIYDPHAASRFDLRTVVFSALALLAMGIYGFSRARTILERRAASQLFGFLRIA